jgi:hypothetical protein
MRLVDLKRLLANAEALFRGAGAARQADIVREVEAALPADAQRPFSEAAQHARERLSAPELYELPDEQVVARLVAIRTDKSAFEQLMRQIEHRQFPVAKAVNVARLYVGASKVSWRGKSAAIKAMSQFFDDRAFLSAKADKAAHTTPY